jgi:uncharacterized protein
LESGLQATALYDNEVADLIPEHVSRVFETWCIDWLRAHRSIQATSFGAWWGNAANVFRKSKERTTEEIDVVGARRGVVTLIGEAKWTNKRLTPKIVEDLTAYKIPALRDAGFRVAQDLHVVLFSRSGYTTALHELAAVDARIELIDVATELRQRGHEK